MSGCPTFRWVFSFHTHSLPSLHSHSLLCDIGHCAQAVVTSQWGCWAGEFRGCHALAACPPEHELVPVSLFLHQHWALFITLTLTHLMEKYGFQFSISFLWSLVTGASLLLSTSHFANYPFCSLCLFVSLFV